MGLRCELHDLAAGPDGQCVVCRRGVTAPAPIPASLPGSSTATANARTLAIVATVGIALLGVALQTSIHRATSRDASADLAPSGPATTAPVTAATAAEATGVQEGARPQVQIYTTAHCPYCIKAKAWLKSHDVPFQEFDVEDDDRARARAVKLGGRGVPIIDVGGEVIRGYSEQALAAAVSRARSRGM